MASAKRAAPAARRPRRRRGPEHAAQPAAAGDGPAGADGEKNANGKISVSFRAHETTGELIVGLCAEDGPAGAAGVVVGDVVLGLQGIVIDQFGEAAVDEAMNILADTAHLPTVEIVVQTRLRMEVLEFGLDLDDAAAATNPDEPPRALGLTFYSFPDDKYVRVTKVGRGARLGASPGDRIVSVNGTRVNHAERTVGAHPDRRGGL